MQVIKPYLGETHNHQKAASKSWTAWSTATQSSMQSMLNSPQNGRSTCT